MEAFEEKLCHRFGDRRLLETALTHSSYANESRAAGCECNERLEFLGDSILGMVVADALFRRFPDMPEGRMTRLRARLVCEESLHAVASELGLGSYIRLGRGEEHTGGRQRASILADAVEAVIAALYLDGGMDSARRLWCVISALSPKWTSMPPFGPKATASTSSTRLASAIGSTAPKNSPVGTE